MEGGKAKTKVYFGFSLCLQVTSLVAQTVKRLSTMRETRVRSLGGEDLLEKEMATQLCLTFCDLMDCSTPGFPVYHQLPELAQTHVH